MFGVNFLAVIREGARIPSPFGPETSVNMAAEQGKRSDLPNARRRGNRRQDRRLNLTSGLPPTHERVALLGVAQLRSLRSSHSATPYPASLRRQIEM